jgi:NAD(P)-dependent dehydrogenase (short-subunit alcohol dehydrogenase family)
LTSPSLERQHVATKCGAVHEHVLGQGIDRQGPAPFQFRHITGRREAELASAVKDIGKNVTALQGDVSKLDDLDRVVAQIKEIKDKLDIVFANAGVAKYAALGEITEELYDTIFDINVKGMLFTVQKALPLMPDGSAIIVTSSIVGSKGLGANRRTDVLSPRMIRIVADLSGDWRRASAPLTYVAAHTRLLATKVE